MPQILLLSTTTEIAGQSGKKNFSRKPATGKEYSKHSAHTQYTHLAGPFEFCGRILGQWPTIRKNSTPLPHLYIYISLTVTDLLLHCDEAMVTPLYTTSSKGEPLAKMALPNG